MRRFFAKLFATYIFLKNKRWIYNPIESQKRTLRKLIKKASKTKFGIDHGFNKIHSYQDYIDNVPIRDYEEIKPYIDIVIAGKKNVLWPGKPLYFSKTSGTTSGIKYIPISKESMPTHIKSARDAILNYIYYSGNTSFINGKQIFLQGSPVLEKINNISVGRLSGIVAHYVPSYLQKNRLPSWEVNCIKDWDKKVDLIVEETINEKMTLIGGIPPWVQMYFEKILEKKGENIGEVFKHFSLFIYGGVNFEPYKNVFNKLIGKKIDTIELFPASEGFFAYQDKYNKKDLLLLLNNGIFYEFVDASKFFNDDKKRLSLEQVELGVVYVMIISSNAGLWSYNVGDTVKFTSLYPFRILVTGRLKHFISAFGEHVIGIEVERAVKNVLKNTLVEIVEFSVAPQVSPSKGLPYHEWMIEFRNHPKDIEEFSKKLDLQIQAQNSYYKDLIEGKILRTLKITKIKKKGFQQYMNSIGKLGGQNKVPRLSNDRELANKLIKFSI
jgi:hypothetical protein